MLITGIRILIEHAGGADLDVLGLLMVGIIAAVGVAWIVWASILIRRYGPVKSEARHASAKTKYF
ncbi:hypothetical protein B7R21_06225 [Subtercola boreus]|uniref:Uncharacterized protein n=1 Tax=Subtercola boreus TaxID=120213 RepID=A0A3E0VYX4_9MICO|nr:hypothetical protein B7R21_06225 [Subtercola boreus]